MRGGEREAEDGPDDDDKRGGELAAGAARGRDLDELDAARADDALAKQGEANDEAGAAEAEDPDRHGRFAPHVAVGEVELGD